MTLARGALLFTVALGVACGHSGSRSRIRSLPQPAWLRPGFVLAVLENDEGRYEALRIGRAESMGAEDEIVLLEVSRSSDLISCIEPPTSLADAGQLRGYLKYITGLDDVDHDQDLKSESSDDHDGFGFYGARTGARWEVGLDFERADGWHLRTATYRDRSKEEPARVFVVEEVMGRDGSYRKERSTQVEVGRTAEKFEPIGRK